MGEELEKKSGNTFFTDVAKTVIAGIIMLVCTTVYNLVLAHIWPVTIHFGEYSLNNFIFILVSILSSVLLALLILAVEILYIFSSIAITIIDHITPKDKRIKRKHHWHEFILNTILLAALGLLNGILWLVTIKSRRAIYKTASSEDTTGVLENLPAMKNEQKSS